jgi:hypothetical protein
LCWKHYTFLYAFSSEQAALSYVEAFKKVHEDKDFEYGSFETGSEDDGSKISLAVYNKTLSGKYTGFQAQTHIYETPVRDDNTWWLQVGATVSWDFCDED